MTEDASGGRWSVAYPRPQRAGRARVREIDFGESPPRGAGALLLDSHIWLWLLSGHHDRIPTPVMQELTRADRGTPLAVSDATPWELMTKAHRGRLVLELPPTIWMARALEAPGIRLVPLRRAVLLDAATLPDGAPRDPFDRVIIATARMDGMTLVTADQAIIQWGRETGGVRVLES
ncbi:MAG: type II toxin-antitoxin system VapC family toxin [Gemmatimonadetes bacterium]|nr:type II toxin-antitoxin system VapC family toxin [Gemmatimonadota bacterium]